MSGDRKLLLFGGVVLAAIGMLYGLHYAIFVEHQTLDRMGGSLATAFLRAADRQEAESRAALDDYGQTRYDYVRQVDVHSHWIGLAMLMIVLGVVFDGVAFSERTRLGLASMLFFGSVVFPLGVILQTFGGGTLASGMAAGGAGLVILALTAISVGFARQRA